MSSATQTENGTQDAVNAMRGHGMKDMTCASTPHALAYGINECDALQYARSVEDDAQATQPMGHARCHTGVKTVTNCGGTHLA